jgi:hypothetical protein
MPSSDLHSILTFSMNTHGCWKTNIGPLDVLLYFYSAYFLQFMMNTSSSSFQECSFALAKEISKTHFFVFQFPSLFHSMY